MKKKVLILGGSSDIGSVLAKNFLGKEENYELHLHYNSNLKILKNFEYKCNLIKADLSSSNYQNTLKKFNNNYDVIINLTGYITNQSFENFKVKEFYKTINANSLIPLLIIRKSLNNMKKKNFGRIINTSSIGVKFGGGKSVFLYSLSKHINEFIPNHIRKLSNKNILYNCLRIGVVNTKFQKKIKNKDLKKRVSLIPVRRMAKIDEITDLIFYLIDKNNFMNNDVINIAGGE